MKNIEEFREWFKAELEKDIASGRFEKEWEERRERDRLKSIEQTDHLLNCPCCGGRPVRYPGEYQGAMGGEVGVWENIQCSVCYLQTEGIYGELSAEDVWQKRI